MERLSKFIARTSSFSRRKAEDLIREGKVKVNKAVVLEPFVQVDSDDIIAIDNKIIYSDPVKLYIALNKPDGFMSDLQDTKDRRVARELVKLDLRLYPVGRLDYHSDGLMIFTNDGEFANETMHPRYGIEKEYLVKFKGLLTRDDISRMKEGIRIEDSSDDYQKRAAGRTADKDPAGPPVKKKPATKKEKEGWDLYKVDDIRLLKAVTKNGWYSVVVSEGKNRMIRKLGEAVGHQVLKLTRVRIGSLELGDLKPGEYRYFEKKEITAKKHSAKRIRII